MRSSRCAWLAEVVRVTGRYLIIKDHVPQGLLAQPRICFMDWAANRPYGVKCLFEYPSVEQWHERYEEIGLKLVDERTSIDLYPAGFNLVFGKKLQYFAVLEKNLD